MAGNDFFHNRTYHMYEQLACYYLAVLYFGLLLATSVMFYLTVRREASFWTTQKVTFLFIMLSCVGRTAFFALLPDGPWNFQAKSFDLFWTQPALFIFTTFTVMLFHWAKVYFQQRDNAQLNVDTAKYVCIAVNVVTYLTQLALYFVLFVYDEKDEHFSSIEPYMLTVLFFLASVCVVILGGVMYCKTREKVVSQLQATNQRRLAMVTSFLTFGFTVRGIVNIMWNGVISKLTAHHFFIFLAVFYCVVEIIPLAAVLTFASRVPRKRVLLDTAGSSNYFDQSGTYDDAIYDDEDGFFNDTPQFAPNFANESLVVAADRLRTSLALNPGVVVESPTNSVQSSHSLLRAGALPLNQRSESNLRRSNRSDNLN